MFLVIPLDRKPDWRNPPLVTLALIIVNTLVYLFWQHSDYDYLVEAYSYYEESGLYRIELEHYKSYRQTHAPLDASTELSESEEQQLIGARWRQRVQPHLGVKGLAAPAVLILRAVVDQEEAGGRQALDHAVKERLRLRNCLKRLSGG